MANFEDTNPVVQSCRYNVCQGCVFTNIEFYQMLTTNEKARQFLIEHGVLACHSLCEECGSRLSANERNQFRCRKSNHDQNLGRRRCNSSRSVLKGTFLEGMHLSMKQICFLVDLFLSCRRSKTVETMFELKISQHTVVDWFSFCREVVEDYIIRVSEPIGGVGEIVEIDEAMLGHRKYNRGRVLSEQWVIGGIQRGVQSGCKAFLVPVENRNPETLIGIIKRFVLPGTTVMTDSWWAYNSLQSEGCQHFTVNHSENFVDPQSGAHTQTVERLWVEVRRHVPSAGFRRESLSGYLADVIFRRMIPCYGRRRHIFWKAAATFYSPDHTLA